MVRELLGREEIHVAEAPSVSPAMSIGETTPEFLNACRRLLDLLDTRQDIPFLSGLIQREIIYRVLRGPVGARLRAVATLGDQATGQQRRCVDHRELRSAVTRGGTRAACEHGRIDATSPFSDADLDESASVSETAPPSVGSEPDAEQWP